MGMRIRNFMADDVDKVVELWNVSLWKDSNAGKPSWYIRRNLLTNEQLMKKISDSNFDQSGSFVACQNDRIVGFGASMIRDQTGYISGLVVHPSFRRRRIGTELYQKILTYCRGQGAKKAELGFNFSTGILENRPEYYFLISKGFRFHPMLKLMTFILYFKDFKLKDEILEIRRKLEDEGIRIQYYEPRYKKSLSFSKFEGQDWFSRESWIPSMWKSITDSRNIDDELIVTHGERVVGFMGLTHVEEWGEAAHQGPFVDPEYRGRKIGKVLVNLWCHEVKKKGAWYSFIGVYVNNYYAQKCYFYAGYKKLGEIYTVFESVNI